VNCLEPNSQSLFFESDPVFLDAVDGNDNLFEDIRVSLTEVVFKKRIAIGKVFIKSFLVLGQPNNLSDVLQLQSLAIINYSVLLLNLILPAA